VPARQLPIGQLIYDLQLVLVPLKQKSGVQTKTLELGDFGVPVDSPDWTRFPE